MGAGLRRDEGIAPYGGESLAWCVIVHIVGRVDSARRIFPIPRRGRRPRRPVVGFTPSVGRGDHIPPQNGEHAISFCSRDIVSDGPFVGFAVRYIVLPSVGRGALTPPNNIDAGLRRDEGTNIQIQYIFASINFPPRGIAAAVGG